MPLAIALPASCRSSREFCVSNDASATVDAGAREARRVFERGAERVERRDVRQRLDDDGDLRLRELLGDHPRLRTRPSSTSRTLNSSARRIAASRSLARLAWIASGICPFSTGCSASRSRRAARVVAALLRVEGDAIDAVVLRVLQHLAQPQDRGRARSARHARARFAEQRHHRRRRARHARRHLRAAEVHHRALPREHVAGAAGRDQRARDAFDARDRECTVELPLNASTTLNAALTRASVVV